MSYRATTVRNVSFPSGSTVSFDQAAGDSVLAVGYATVYPQSALYSDLAKTPAGVVIAISAVSGGGTVTATIISNPHSRTIRANDICSMGQAYMTPGTPFILSDPAINPNAVTQSLLHVEATKAASYVMANFAFVQTGTGFDSGATRALAYSLAAGSNSIRASEHHVLRGTAATANGTWGLEIGVHSQVAGLGPTYNVGIYLASSHSGWLASGVRNDTGLLITGEDGWKHFIRCYDTNGSSVLFEVNQYGQAGFGTGTIDANTMITIVKGALAYIEFPTADATDPTGGGGAAAGRLPVIVNGVLKYLPYY